MGAHSLNPLVKNKANLFPVTLGFSVEDEYPVPVSLTHLPAGICPALGDQIVSKAFTFWDMVKPLFKTVFDGAAFFQHQPTIFLVGNQLVAGLKPSARRAGLRGSPAGPGR